MPYLFRQSCKFCSAESLRSEVNKHGLEVIVHSFNLIPRGLTMSLENCNPTKELISPNLSLPSTFSPETTIPAPVKSASAWPYTRSNPGQDCLEDASHHLNGLLNGPEPPRSSKNQLCLPTPPETLVKHFQKPKSDAKTSAADLPSLPTSSEDLSTDLLPGEHFNHDIESPTEASTLRVPKSELVNLDATSLKSSSAESSVSNTSERFSPVSKLDVYWRFLPSGSNIMASIKRRRAQAHTRRPRKSQVDRIFRSIKEIHKRKYSGTQSSTTTGLSPSEYQELLVRIEANEELAEFFNEELR